MPTTTSPCLSFRHSADSIVHSQMSKYLPQCNGNAIYAGRTYPAVKDFHDYGSVNAQAAQYHKFPIGQ
eukprot:3159916-Amphidinium_carterae.1